MVDVEVSSLGALDENCLAGCYCLIQVQRCVSSVGLQSLSVRQIGLDDFISVKGRVIVQTGEQFVYHTKVGPHLLSEHVGRNAIDDSDPGARHLVLVTWPDPTTGCSDILIASPHF